MFKSRKQLAADLIEAQAKRAASEASLALATDALDMLEKRMNDRAALISIVRDGRKIRFGFVRNQELHYIEMLGMWADDVDGWKAALLEKRE